MPHEIEIKFRATDTQFKLLKDWLQDNAEFKGEYSQKDVYLNNPNSSFYFTAFAGYKDSLDYLRVRFTKKGDSVCYKKFYREAEDSDKTSHCDEYEYEVSDGEMALKKYHALGYTEETIIDKTRKKYISDKFEIVIDDVKDLGIFIEFELLDQIDDPTKGRQIIREALKEIGITDIDEQERGYVSMLWNPDYDFGEDS